MPLIRHSLFDHTPGRRRSWPGRPGLPKLSSSEVLCVSHAAERREEPYESGWPAKAPSVRVERLNRGQRAFPFKALVVR
jgi:hypothetical protein